MRKGIIGLVVVAAQALWALPVAADVLTVDCDGDAQFQGIAAAVMAAQDGDVIVVRECETMPFTYAPFEVSGKLDLHIVAGDQTVAGGVGSMELGVGVVIPNFRPIAMISGTGECVRIIGSTRVLVKGFELADCTSHGVQISGSTNVSVIGNKILRVDGDGVRDDSSDGSYINGNVIGLSDGAGVVLTNSTNARVADNMVGFNGSRGASINSPIPLGEAAGGALANTIVNNTFIENPTNCIFDGGGDTKIEANTCSGATTPPRTITIDEFAFDGEVVSNIGIIDDPFGNSDESDNCPVSAPC